MTQRLLLVFLAATTLLSSGCVSRLWRKSDKPKETGAIASDVEREFRSRWIAKRVSELAFHGVTGAAAQEQATREFQEKFNFPTRKK